MPRFHALLACTALLVACGGRSELALQEGEARVLEPWCEDCTVTDRCASTDWEQTVVVAHFDNPGGCDWGQDGNLTEDNGIVRARVEQRVSLSLPSDGVICDMRFAIDHTTMVYDDHLIVTFDDVIVMSALHALDQATRLDRKGEFYFYDWFALRGAPLRFGEYCLGECQLPTTEKEGDFELALSVSQVQRLGWLADTEDRAELSVITTGDDNPSEDCRHTPFDMEVTLLYAPD